MSFELLNLSPYEFEELSRDILQIREKVTFENFSEGQDDGVDLRYSRGLDNSIIVQAKRYKEWNSFFQIIKKEKKKVIDLNPDRYIITTTVKLGKKEKDKIINEINDNGQKFIKSYDDIVDGNLINNLLNQELYRDIRNSNVKLWFNSFEILKDVVHAEEINYSLNEKNELDKNSKIYVKNDSFNEAVEILENNSFVIISGIPGIGKTSLARILSSYYLQVKKFKQFYAISNHIKNGFKFFRKGEKQIFFYDDFLGKNFLETLLKKNEDESIIKFIKAVQSDAKNKICIFTTREYILKQAQYKYERLDNPLLNAQKCTVDLKKYTKTIKAQILFNHLFFSEINKEYIINLLENNLINELIEHRNFNPRIISAITREEEIWKAIEPTQFFNKFKQYLDYPNKIWQHLFENTNTLMPMSKEILLVLTTFGKEVSCENLEKAVENYIQKERRFFDLDDFERSVKQLDGSFIKTYNTEQNKIIISFQNPSIKDFIINYFNLKSRNIKKTIEANLYVEQFVGVFSKNQQNKIQLSDELSLLFTEKLICEFDNLKIVYPAKVDIYGSYSKIYTFSLDETLYKLSLLSEFLLLNQGFIKLEDFVKEKFKKIEISKIKKNDFHLYINVLENLFSEHLFIDKVSLMKTYLTLCNNWNDLHLFEYFYELFNESFIKEFGELYFEIDYDDKSKKVGETPFGEKLFLSKDTKKIEWLEKREEQRLKAFYDNVNNKKIIEILEKAFDEFDNEIAEYEEYPKKYRDELSALENEFSEFCKLYCRFMGGDPFELELQNNFYDLLAVATHADDYFDDFQIRNNKKDNNNMTDEEIIKLFKTLIDE